jgi:Restriction endonuclease
MLEYQVEVTVKEGDSSTERGALLERLTRRVLEAQQFDFVSSNIRVTGSELDVVAEDRQTGAKIFVECKAYRDKSINAEVLKKLAGTLFVQDEYRAAWLVCTSEFGKDAQGLLEQMRLKPIAEREKIRVWGPQQLIELLSSTGSIVPAASLVISSDFHILDSRTLCITDVGEFWAVTAVGKTSGVADTVLAFDARTGKPVTNEALLQELGARDSNLKGYQWVAGGIDTVPVGSAAEIALKQELDSIAPVPVADDWSDYRPARPEDFVGRDDLQREIVKFFEDVRGGNSSTRLLAIKAPSGWGKSSFLVKLRSVCATARSRDKYFVYAVDCRTASSPRYPDLALKRAFEEAISAEFVSPPMQQQVVIPSAGQPFSDASVVGLLEQLRERKKVLVLFFDQFEEITTKQELADLFGQVRTLCSAIESAQENVVLGFSWKTDGSVPADHPAYHVWHSFKDRRREFDLPTFSKGDMAKLLGGLSRALKTPIEPSLRRTLSEHCQGYPWLLKKLCVHVFQVLQSKPTKQRDLLERALDIEALFQRDLADLSAPQLACLERIARDSPADHFKVVEIFTDKVVESLTHRRLIVRNSAKLVVYWDIFRDFVLFGKVPAIPGRYIPVSSPPAAKRLIELVRQPTSLTRLASQLGVQPVTLDNVARDMVMMGMCVYHRKNERLSRLHDTDAATLSAAFRFFGNHVLLRATHEAFGSDFRRVPLANIYRIWRSEFPSSEYADKTIATIGRRMIAWFQAFGILVVESGDLVSSRPQQLPPTEFGQFGAEGRRHRHTRLFFGESPPARVMELVQRMLRADFVAASGDRNALYVLNALRLITSATDPILLDRPRKGEEQNWLAIKVSSQSTVQAALRMYGKQPDSTGYEIGQLLAGLFNLGISDGSMRRYGAGVLVWVRWLHDIGFVRRRSRHALGQ